jgi:hypothetical protein
MVGANFYAFCNYGKGCNSLRRSRPTGPKDSKIPSGKIFVFPNKNISLQKQNNCLLKQKYFVPTKEKIFVFWTKNTFLLKQKYLSSEAKMFVF